MYVMHMSIVHIHIMHIFYRSIVMCIFVYIHENVWQICMSQSKKHMPIHRSCIDMNDFCIDMKSQISMSFQHQNRVWMARNSIWFVKKKLPTVF